MTWLLDVSAVVAYLVKSHEHHACVSAWRAGKELALCPITELGFLRVACALGFGIRDARETLIEFVREEHTLFLPCDRRAFDGPTAGSARQTTDIYLAELARSRGWRLATLDAGILHPAADLIPKLQSV